MKNTNNNGKHFSAPVKAIVISAATGAAVYAIAANVFYSMNLKRQGLEGALRQKIYDAVAGDTYDEMPIFQEGIDWFNNHEKEKVTIVAPTGENLYADVMKAKKPTDVWVICVHGYTSGSMYMGMYAKYFYDEFGYNVLMPSLNGRADSENDKVTMGWDDRLIVVEWIKYLTEKYPECKIVLHGVSMGAATVMMACGEELPDNVKCAVEDCGYTSVWDIFEYQIKNVTKVPKSMLLYSVDMVTKLRSKYDFKDASCIEQLKKSKTPMLFIHGEEDDFVPYRMLDEVYDACPTEKEKVSIPDAIHARSCCYHPEIYWPAIKSFIEKYTK